MPRDFKLPDLSWSGLAPEWFTSNSKTLRNFLAAPTVFIVSAVAGWAVENLVIRPFAWGVAILDWMVSHTLEIVSSSLRTALGDAGEKIMMGIVGTPRNPGAIRSFNQTLEGVFVGAGLGAPIASALVFGLWGMLVLTFLYFFVRAIIDAVPGGGAFL